MSDSKDKTMRPRHSLFRRTSEGIPEIDPASSQRDRAPKRQRIKATFYLEPDDVLAIDQMQSEEFRTTGKKPERSELVSQAIQAYLNSRKGS
ncbi:MAG: hypothetical protein O2854_04915 [Chloroflexi bacterium]|nr:hypothetical protein [Chloroflexota bacterium]